MRMFLLLTGLILFLVALVAGYEGIAAYVKAKSAFHQIYAAVLMVLFAVSIGIGAILIALSERQGKTSQPVAHHIKRA